VTINKKQWINNDKYGLVTIIWLRNSKNVAPRELQKFLVNMDAPSLHRSVLDLL
jgi:beta-lactamase class D